MNPAQRLRARLILIGIIIAAIALLASLYSKQIVNGDAYANKAARQYGRPNASLFDRGSIFFAARDGTFPPAAAISTGYVVYMNPTLVTDAPAAFQALSQYISLDRAEFIRKAGKAGDRYEELARRASEETADSIRALRIAGVGVTKETWRSYPGRLLAAHAIGIIGERSSSSATSTVSDQGIVMEGRYGLERSYESTLARKNFASTANIFAELFSGLRGDGAGDASHKQGDIVTTIEPTVQEYLQKVLSETSGHWNPDEIGGIIIDPTTGEVTALAAFPTFDPGRLSDIKNVSVLSNPLVEHVYELGSIMKPLTMAAALDSGAVTTASTYNDTGTMTLDAKTIANYDGKARGVVPMQEILSQSLNIGAATIALKTGKATFAKYLADYGLGKKTGIDLPNEASGLIRNLESGRDIETATAAYGQGIAISPIEMVQALSIIANQGKIAKPHVVKEIQYADGTTERIAPSVSDQIVKKQTAEDVTRMLVKVVDTALKKGALKMDHYSIAAKTGTAQMPDHVHGGYYKDRYLHSFFGYFPAYDPKFLVFLYQIYPKGAQYASETLTDPFDELAKFLINYYNIPPDR